MRSCAGSPPRAVRVVRALGAHRSATGAAPARRRPARSPPRSRHRLRASGGAVPARLPAARRRLHGFPQGPAHGRGTADFIWVPEHDSLRGPNVLRTITSPHRVSASRLDAARAAPDARLARLSGRRVAVLLGGDSRHLRFSEDMIARLLVDLRRLAATGCSLMVTASRRTPERLREPTRLLAAETGGFFWDGTGENPYVAMLALAEAIVVTSDSVNMVSEAVATGARSCSARSRGHRPATKRCMRHWRVPGRSRRLTDGSRICGIPPSTRRR